MNIHKQSLFESLHPRMSEFWSGDLGLTLVTLSLIILIFITIPLREAGVPSRYLFDLLIIGLMVFGTLSTPQSRIIRAFVISLVFATALVLGISRLHPTPFLHEVGSALATVTLLLYARIVLLLMFRSGPVTWSRIQGGVSVYLLIGMAWASAFQLVEQLLPGSFQFVTTPKNMDELTSKLTYFSFCTLTTIGSQIAPIRPFARSLTIAEAIVGQLYPALLIGALVALAMQSRRKT